jgi:ABC transporter with metal-binding/Fe-S-binding domain ATP-binding protein
MVPELRDSWMFHHPAVEWTGLQANALGFPAVTAKTSGLKEEELTALRQSLSGLVTSLGIECVVTGAIASEYQRSRIDRICDELGIQAIAPLWGKSPKRLLREEIEMGFEFVLTACMAMGLDQSWLGRVIDMDALKELESISQRHGINLAFEGGEAETFVTDAPIFSKRIRIVEAEPIWKGDSGYLRIVRAEFDEGSRKRV